MKKNKKGFTLTELIVVIAIVAILSAVLIPTITGYIEKARESNALVEAREVSKLYQYFVIEEENTSTDIRDRCDQFLAYVKRMAPNYESRINYAIIAKADDVQTLSYLEVADGEVDGRVVFLIASSNGLYITTSITYGNNSLSNSMDSFDVYKDLQVATNSVFSGDEEKHADLEKWEFAIAEGEFKFSTELYEVNICNWNSDENIRKAGLNKFATINVRAGKVLTKQYLDSYFNTISFYAYDTQVEDSYLMDNFYFKNNVKWLNSSDEEWDFSQTITGDTNIYGTNIDVEYDAVAKIERQGEVVYDLFYKFFPNYLEEEEYGYIKQMVINVEPIGANKVEKLNGIQSQKATTFTYYFSDISSAISFAGEYQRADQARFDIYNTAKVDGVFTAVSKNKSFYIDLDIVEKQLARKLKLDYKTAVAPTKSTYYDVLELIDGKEAVLTSNATLKAGCKLLIPCGEDVYGSNYTSNLYASSTNWYDYINRDPYSVPEVVTPNLKINENVKLDVYGEVVIGAYLSSFKNFVQNEVYVDGDKGGFGVLENNGTINIQEGATLTSYGYLIGEGVVNGLGGSKIVDLFTLKNWPGGSAADAMCKKDENGEFIVDENNIRFLELSPFNIYTMSNIRCRTVSSYGSEYALHLIVYFPAAGGFDFTTTIILIGKWQEGDNREPLFSFTDDADARVEKTYNDEEGVTELKFFGDMFDNKFAFEKYQLSGAYFPMYKMNIIIEEGTFNISSNKFMLMPGSSIIVKENATVNFSGTGGIAVMDKLVLSDDAKNYYPTTPAIANVYGTIKGQGAVTGVINVLGSGKVEADNFIIYDEVEYGAGMIKLVNGAYPLQADTCLLTIKNNDTVTKYTVLYIDGDVLTPTSYSSDLTLVEPTKEGYTFGGWYTTHTFDEGTSVTTVDTSTILYAKWTEN